MAISLLFLRNPYSYYIEYHEKLYRSKEIIIIILNDIYTEWTYIILVLRHMKRSCTLSLLRDYATIRKTAEVSYNHLSTEFRNGMYTNLHIIYS